MNFEVRNEVVAEPAQARWSGATADPPAVDAAAPAHEHDNAAQASGPSFREMALTLMRSWLVRTAAILVGLVFWYWAAKVHLDFYIRFDNVPTPLAVAEALWRHAHEAKFYVHIAVSMERIVTGYTLAAAVGIVLGLLMGRLPIMRDLLTPYIELLRPIPAVAWIPLAILMWPTEESSIIYIVFLGALFPIVLNTIHGVEQTPEVLVRAAESLGAGRFAWNAYSLIQYPDIVVGMLLIGVFGTLSTYGVQLLMRPLLAWQRRTR